VRGAERFPVQNLARQPEWKAVQERPRRKLPIWRGETQDPSRDVAALRDPVLKENDAPPLPACRKARQPKAASQRGGAKDRQRAGCMGTTIGLS